jgi:hypothetical protein
MASVGGDVAGIDRDGAGIGALDAHAEGALPLILTSSKFSTEQFASMRFDRTLPIDVLYRSAVAAKASGNWRA